MAEEVRRCGSCGSVIPRGRVGAWCSSWCQGRAEQGLPPEQPPAIPVIPPAPGRSSRRPSLVERVAETLEAVGLAGTWEAAAALDLADSLDSGGGSGAARAAWHKELRATMAGALRGVDDPGTRVGAMRNELAERRARRAGGAG